MTTRIRSIVAFTATLLAALAGCIVSDTLSTLTIRPDGSADWVEVRSNIRSTESGAKGAREIAAYIAAFEAGEDSARERLRRAGAEILESRWLRREPPCANAVVARFPTAATLEAFFRFEDENGKALTEARFARTGDRCRFSILVHISGEAPAEGPATVAELRQNQADDLSETRIVVADGHITGARGFTVASDKRSALFDASALAALSDGSEPPLELFLEWEVVSVED
jgi:hypothetical protein